MSTMLYKKPEDKTEEITRSLSKILPNALIEYRRIGSRYEKLDPVLLFNHINERVFNSLARDALYKDVIDNSYIVNDDVKSDEPLQRLYVFNKYNVYALFGLEWSTKETGIGLTYKIAQNRVDFRLLKRISNSQARILNSNHAIFKDDSMKHACDFFTTIERWLLKFGFSERITKDRLEALL